MGSKRSRKVKAREFFNDHLDEIFAQLAAHREDRPEREEKPKPQPKGAEKPKQEPKEKENPNHPCYKCIGCIHWTKCVGYSQLLECIEQRKRAYEKRIAGNG